MCIMAGITGIFIELGWTRSAAIEKLDQARHVKTWLFFPLGIVVMIIVSFFYLAFGKFKKAAEIRWGLSALITALFTGSRY